MTKTTQTTRARKVGQGSKWCRPSTRLAIYNRDGFACAYCSGGSEHGSKLTLDHVLACELGGTNSPTNLVTACLSCNSAKQDLSMRGWFSYLRAKGIDTSKLSARIRTLTGKALDRDAGRALLADRKATKQAA